MRKAVWPSWTDVLKDINCRRNKKLVINGHYHQSRQKQKSASKTVCQWYFQPEHWNIHERAPCGRKSMLRGRWYMKGLVECRLAAPFQSDPPLFWIFMNNEDSANICRPKKLIKTFAHLKLTENHEIVVICWERRDLSGSVGVEASEIILVVGREVSHSRCFRRTLIKII